MRRLWKALRPTIRNFGVDVRVTWVDKSTPCPCTNNSWHTFDPEWHNNHPDEPYCEGTGFLAADGGNPTKESTIRAVVIPNYGRSAEDFAEMVPGNLPEWAWLCVTQDTTQFQYLYHPYQTFQVDADLPYFIEGNLDVPAVRIIVLKPLNTHESVET